MNQLKIVRIWRYTADRSNRITATAVGNGACTYLVDDQAGILAILLHLPHFIQRRALVQPGSNITRLPLCPDLGEQTFGPAVTEVTCPVLSFLSIRLEPD